MAKTEVNNEFYLDKEFEKRCEKAVIDIKDARHYCNEGTIYEFKSRNDLMKAQAIYFGLTLHCPEGFRVEFWSCGDVHHMFSKYPDID